MKKIFKTFFKIVQFYRFSSLVILYRYCIFIVYKENVVFTRKVLNQIFEIGYKIKYLLSPNESTTLLHKLGYSPIKTINDCPLVRGVYANIETNHALDCMVSLGGIRIVLLEFKK